MQKALVLYHGGCPDGMTAAWAAWRALGDNAEYRPIRYHEPVPKDAKDRDVYLLDFCFNTKEQMSELLQLARSVTVLDHHKSAAPIIKHGADNAYHYYTSFKAVFDESHSGAHIAWKYFHPNRPLLALVNYVEDRDLWKWVLPASKAANAYIGSIPLTLEDYNHLSDELEIWDKYGENAKGIYARGQAILRYQDTLVEAMASQAEFAWFQGYIVLCAPAPVLHSEVCGRLAKDMPFGLTYRTYPDGTRAYDLRFREWFGKKMDVSAFAKKMGGGGHIAAAGFQVKPLTIRLGQNPVQHGIEITGLPISPDGLPKAPILIVEDAARITREIIHTENDADYLQAAYEFKDLDMTTRKLVLQNLNVRF